MAARQMEHWTNESVLRLAGKADPLHVVTQKAQEEVLKAIQAGWQGPPFDPFKLADLLGIPTIPREDVLDARVVSGSSNRLQIEFNPNRPWGRVRFSIAHELAHALFPDCAESIRNRGRTDTQERDDWQLELLCNVAAAEFLMPVGDEIDPCSPVTVDNIMRLQKEFDVSTEAIAIRLAKVTMAPCTVVAVRPVVVDERLLSYRLDYNVPSRASAIELSRGLRFDSTVLSQCTAVGYTAKGTLRDIGRFSELYLECVGIPPYRGESYPRIIGVAQQRDAKPMQAKSLVSVRGNALEPRGTGPVIVAQVVNDKTPNWGAGFARALKDKFPSVQRDFRTWVASNPGAFSLGNAHVAQVNDNLRVVSMIAQRGYGESNRPRIRYAALRDCLKQLKNVADDVGATVHMPRIGTGYAGGNWSYIAELIDEELVRHAIGVTIYTLPDAEINETQGALGLNWQSGPNVATGHVRHGKHSCLTG